jgi:radical SAM protein with 4Fe4S-binding SPASM domain
MNKYDLKELKIEVTYYCPLACIHCSSDAHILNNIAMTRNKCFEIIKEAQKMGVKTIAFSGGEPLTWVGLEEAVDYCNINNIETTIYTSGNCDNLENKLSKLSSKGLKRAVFSLYSDEEKEHIRITRKKDSFKNTLRAIDIANKNGIDSEIHFVAMKMNYSRLPEVAKLSKDIRVKKISVLRFVPQGRGEILYNGVLDKKQNKELRDIILNLRREGYDIRTGSPWNVLWLNEHPRCMAAQDRMIVSPELRIYPCDAFKQIRFEEIVPYDEYSNLESKNLKECWEKSQYFGTIRKKQDCKPEKPCLGCDKYEECKAGCLAQKYLKYGNLNQNPDPICIRGII